MIEIKDEEVEKIAALIKKTVCARLSRMPSQQHDPADPEVATYMAVRIYSEFTALLDELPADLSTEIERYVGERLTENFLVECIREAPTTSLSSAKAKHPSKKKPSTEGMAVLHGHVSHPTNAEHIAAAQRQ